MIKVEKGNCSIVGVQNEVFVELSVLMFGIREKMGDEEAEKFVQNAFIFSGHGLDKIKLAAAFCEIFNDENPNEQGGIK